MPGMRQPVMVADAAIQPQAAISPGVCAPGELTAEELLHRADTTMYQAKTRPQTRVAHRQDEAV